MSVPIRPQNSASVSTQQQIQRVNINICVNHPVGAPQFAAISTNTPDELDIFGAGQTSLFTAFPHDRGTFNGIVVDRSAAVVDGSSSSSSNINNKQQKVQCFASWAAPESYKNFFALSTGEGDVSDNDDDDDGEVDEAENDLDVGDEDDDDDENRDDADDGEGNGDDDGGGSDEAQSQKRTKRRKGDNNRKGRKRHHVAFKRLPEKRSEAWFVLSAAPTAESDGSNGITTYDMLPLLEVFSCQRRAFEETGKQQGQDGKVPQLYQIPGARIRARKD